MNRRLLILTSSFPRYMGDSAGNFVFQLAKKLKEREFRVTILCPHHPDAKFKEDMFGLNVYRFPYFYPFSYQKIYRDGGILYNLRKSYLARFQIPFLFLSQLFYTIKIIRKDKIDLIHSHWIIPSGLIGAICKKLFKIKHITTAHAGDVFTIKNFMYLNKISSFVFRNSDKITANSIYTMDAILSIDNNMKDNIEIIPMGVDMSIFNPKWRNKDFKINFGAKYIIFSVGRLVEKKGIKYLIMAMKYLTKEFSDSKLIIGGSGPERENLEILSKELGLTDKVIFTGYIKNSELPIYYASHDVFVLPSIMTREGDTEGLGIVLLEAMASGTPVIGSNIGGIRDIIEDNKTGFLIEPRNPEDIADKIIKLLADEKLKRKFSSEGLKLIKDKFSWDVVTNIFSKVITKV